MSIWNVDNEYGCIEMQNVENVSIINLCDGKKYKQIRNSRTNTCTMLFHTHKGREVVTGIVSYVNNYFYFWFQMFG